ncbi:hypothetical protein ACJ72_08294 [Emergomyces africanus]|uniref:AMP-binding enzyme C-terminal domain-containing protein n=1 Tax=Emergomyces africanus TaxID=1955775 RepID=A0A1B7NKV5_9EURO|nr:hypothetical protein ACJ72_08294 [Emergomyces africanus]
MMATFDTAAALPDLEASQIQHWVQAKFYTPLPALHFIGMVMTLAATTYLHMTCVIGPPTPPTPQLLVDVFRHSKVEGVLLNPALIDALCLSPEGLQALRELRYVHYAGASLATKSGNLLAPYTCLVPCIGSTEGGGYLNILHENKDAWEYVSFQKDVGAEFHHRTNGVHELVFVRRPECRLQQIFTLYPDRKTFETNDLFIEHPEHKGLWKIIGRSDDYVYLAHADGLYAATLEQEIVAHPSVKSALIGGYGRPAPVLLIELVSTAEVDDVNALKKSLEPYMEKANKHCHDAVKLSFERFIIAKKEKPFITTIKGNPSRLQSLALYEEEIAACFS